MTLGALTAHIGSPMQNYSAERARKPVLSATASSIGLGICGLVLSTPRRLCVLC